jgi:transposase
MARLTQEGHSLAQIAAIYNLSKQRISQILKQASAEGMTVILGREQNRRPKRKPHACVVCQKQIETKTKTCSRECLTKLTTGGKWSKFKFVKYTCSNCGREFERSNYHDSIATRRCGQNRQKFCSRKCYCSSDFFRKIGAPPKKEEE